jgi:hypothetical protein
MGLNNSGALRVLVDIETVALPEAEEFVDLSDIHAPSNWKDEAKIAQYCADKRRELIEKAALDFDLCKIVCVGYWQEDWNEPVVMALPEVVSEAYLICDFWRTLEDRTTVSFNGLEFDLPFLLRRSLYLGVQAPFINIDKYRTNHIDLIQRLSFNGNFKYRPLDFYCKRLKLDVPDDTCSGKDITALVAAEEWEKVKHHNRCDLYKVKALAERMGLLKQQPLMQEAAF